MTAVGQIDLVGISHRFGERQTPLQVLTGVDLRVSPGEFVAVIGPSGCGKSTLLRIAGGLLAPENGQVLLDGRAPALALRRKAVGYVFQDPALLPWRSVRANVELPGEVNRGAGRSCANVDFLLDLVGLRDFAGYFPHQLSGGMRQRVAIARALALEPAVMLMDEPFGSLDLITRDALRDELQRLWLVRRPTVLFVTHSISEAVYLADRVVVLSERPGKIRDVIDIGIDRPRQESDESSAEFVALVARLKAELRAG